jgi:Pectate lyase superfamily protein
METEMDSNSMKFASRRDLLSLGAAAGMASLIDHPHAVYAAERHGKPILSSESQNVRSYGAAGDAATDDTAAFQKGMDAVHKSGGGILYAPPGKYLFHGALTVPPGVTLRGSYGCVPSHVSSQKTPQPAVGEDGTALFVTAGRGSEEGTAFLTLDTNSTVAGLSIYYPEQGVDAAPSAYPWTIVMRGKNPAVLDVELLNPYQGIDASQNERHNIRNVTGQPLRRGIWVDAIYDIGRIENVHFNPWWSHGKVYEWQHANGEAFIFGRSDWEYVLNTFAFGYKTGYKFVKTPTGACNGNFLGIGADDCNRAILVEQSAVFGLLIANGEFTSFHGDDPTMVEVLSSNRGVVRITNSAFWGPCNQVAKIDGVGTVGFSDCTFVQWGKQGEVAAIQAASGSVLIRGCDFRQNKPHISLGAGVSRAIISGNMFSGPAQIQNSSGKDVQIGLNASS